MQNINQHIQDFISQHQLPLSYTAQIHQWFLAISEQLLMHQKSANRPFLVGLHGAQGSGKTTLAACLAHLLETVYGCSAISLSLDDFYLTKSQRQQLAKTVHPLLATRGAPGTHDIQLALDTLNALTKGDLPVALPHFDKLKDDRCPQQQWQKVEQPPQIIIFEGWCMGALPQQEANLQQCINDLEQQQDPDCQWRCYVNDQLTTYYPALFNQMDYWLMLKAPDFDCIFQWRMQQEQFLAQRQNDHSEIAEPMAAPELQQFIQFYQRITEHCLQSLPAQMDTVIVLDEQRRIIRIEHPNQPEKHAANNLLIFTDLDGSLLDHHTYRHDEADPLLDELAQQQIPLILVSSKTQSEIELLQHQLHNPHPFICENGAAVFIPKTYFPSQPEETAETTDYWVREFVPHRQHWLDLIASLKPKYGDDFTTFSDAGIDGIITMTGLDVHAAARAARRQFGEAIAWHGSAVRRTEFIDDLTGLGAQVLQGGRFIHVSGDCDKGRAMLWLRDCYQKYFPEKKWQTLAIGDSDNDIAMLQRADVALLIPSPVHGLPDVLSHRRLFTAPHCGPRGWAHGVKQIINDNAFRTVTNSQEQAYG